MKSLKSMLLTGAMIITIGGSLLIEKNKINIKNEIRIEQPTNLENYFRGDSKYRIISYLDINGDGIEDFCFEGYKSGIFGDRWEYFVSFGTGVREPDKFTTPPKPIASFNNQPDYIGFHDFDKDGDLDFIFGYIKESLFGNKYVTYRIENSQGKFGTKAILVNKQNF